MTSPNMNGLSVWGERHFYRLLLVVDDYGCFEATPAVIRGRCYALQRVKESQVEKWHGELESAGILNFWKDGGRIFGVFVSFDKHNSKYCVTDDGRPTRHRRRTPEPPSEFLAMFCQTLPNPKPNLKPNPKPLVEKVEKNTKGKSEPNFHEEPKADAAATKVWAEVLANFKDKKDRDSWLRPCVATGLTEKVMTIAAPNNLYGEFIKENYLEELTRLAGRVVEITW